MISDLGLDVIVANSELQEGKAIVIQGSDGLRNDAPVKIVE